MAFGLNFPITQSGAGQVKRSIQDIGNAADQAGNRVAGMIKRFAAFALGGAAVNELRKYIDTYTGLQNKLGQVTTGTGNLAAVTRELFDISNATRSSFEGTASLYARVALATKEMGYAQQELLDFTTKVNQAIILSGASSIEAENALVQFTQGLSSGKLAGDELRSVLEQLPQVADVIAKSLGVTRGSLRQLGADGKLTTDVIIKAFEKADHLAVNFANTVPTIGQSFQIIQNKILDFIGNLDKTFGISQKVAKVLLTIGDNFKTVANSVVTALAGVAAGIAVAFAPAAVLYFLGLLNTLNKNPIVVLIAAFASLATWITLMGDQVSIGNDRIATFADLWFVVSNHAQTAFNVISDGINSVLGKAADQINTADTAFAAFFASSGTGFAGMVRAAAKTFDAIGGLLLGFKNVTELVLTTVAGLFSEYFARAYNSVLEKMQAVSNVVLEAINYLREKVGNKPFELINLEKSKMKVDTVNLKDYGGQMMTSILDGFEEQGGALLKIVDSVFDDADKRATERGRDALRREKGSDYLYGGGVLNPKGKNMSTPPVDKDAAKAAKKWAEEFERLKRSLDPVYQATQEVAEATKIFQQAQAKGLITASEYTGWMQKLYNAYEDQIAPLAKYNRELDESIRFGGMLADQQRVEVELFQFTERMRKQNVRLDAQEVEGLRQKIRLRNELEERMEAENRIYEQTNERLMRRAEIEADALIKRAQGGDRTLGAANLASNLGLDIEGTQLAIDAQLESMKAMYGAIDMLRQKDIISAQVAEQLKAKEKLKYDSIYLGYASQFYGNLAVLSQSSNKKIAAVGKAAAVSQATIDGYLAVQKALASAPPPYNYAMATAVGVAAAANVAKILGVAGFAAGGYTGDMGKGRVAGVVHGQEYVMNAAATRANYPALQAMNSGQSVGGVNVTINNQAPGTEFEVNQIDERTVEIIATRVVQQKSDSIMANNLRNPSSKTSRSLSQNTKTVRNY